jgi:hypothetical protein
MLGAVGAEMVVVLRVAE